MTSGEQSLRFPGSAPSVLPVPCSLSPVPCFFAQGVEKNVGGAYTEYAFDASGEPIGENNRTSWTAEFFDFQGRHLVHYQNNAAYFIHPTALGSTSQVTDYSGAMAQDELHYPWGQEWAMVGTLQEERFARLRHRDSEANLDPTQFRMFSSDQGRWLSPDPVGCRDGSGPSEGGAVALGLPAHARCGCRYNPQGLNRYAYVRNSPTNLMDPLGLCSDPGDFNSCFENCAGFLLLLVGIDCDLICGGDLVCLFFCEVEYGAPVTGFCYGTCYLAYCIGASPPPPPPPAPPSSPPPPPVPGPRPIPF